MSIVVAKGTYSFSKHIQAKYEDRHGKHTIIVRVVLIAMCLHLVSHFLMPESDRRRLHRDIGEGHSSATRESEKGEPDV